MTLLGFTFLAPAVLIGLLALPVIWWLLRLTPPRAKQEVFPPTRLLMELPKKEETPAHSPWWLTLLRLAMAALIILALSEPVWNAQDKTLSGDGPVLIVVENGWESGADWQARSDTAAQLLEEANQSSRPVVLTMTSEGAKASLAATDAAEATRRLAAAAPTPLRTDYAPLAGKLSELPQGSFETVIWLSSGLSQAGSEQFARALGGLNAQQIFFFDGAGNDLVAASSVANNPDSLTVALRRAASASLQSGRITAFDAQGRSLSQADFAFESGQTEAQAPFDLPVELRNEVVRVAIDDADHAGAVQLLDERFRRRRVGLISGAKADQAEQPLLSPLYYISRALGPFSEVRESDSANLTESIPQLIEEGASTLVLADIGTLPDAALRSIESWIERGGMLVRFAGPRLASASDDRLVPVDLRRGDRSLGGTLTWGEAQPLAAFSVQSPFDGLTVPPDVTVSRQVLAEPSIDLERKTWASLADGTPLVTATQRGQGWIVLFHVSADAGWSNLPLSGAFVDMLRRIVAVSNGAIAADRARLNSEGSNNQDDVALPPLRLLDGFGQLGQPDAQARPLLASAALTTPVSLENPPGLYGTNDAFVALNLFRGDAELTLFDTDTLPDGAVERSMTATEALNMRPWLLAAAVLLLALDCLAVLWMGGALRRRAQLAGGAAAMALAFMMFTPQSAWAQSAAEADAVVDFENTLRTRLAYVQTGIGRLDEVSRKGLVGLTAFIASRTSLEPGEPVGVDIASDELVFYPLLYWPVDADSPVPDADAMARVDAFMKQGGSVIFDTRDQLSGGFGGGGVTPATQRLRDILAALDVPPLEPVPEDHVLTRAFYLLNVFPGRYLDGQLWVESSAVEEEASPDRPTRLGDGVSSIMITSNDLAGAWAVEADGAPSLPIVPPNPTQRVYAYRTGVNIVMYTLTGNYKSDQVHIPALLERLGQ
ncbi:MAG: DUF4159 domain-containing protein [Ahrensia sp.]|nr:DUF4159 domain-containing protein [Ahrensia sp.]